MNNYEDGKFNLSVNPDGRVSLWDTMRSATQGKEDGEMSFELQLTDAQRATIANMQSRSRKPRKVQA